MAVTHQVEFLVQDSFGRTSPMAWTYVKMTEDFYLEFKQAKETRIKKPAFDEDPEEYDKHEKTLFRAAVKTIVFAAMAAEAAIFDLAAIHLSDAYALKYLDKNDLLGKWAVIPQLVCGTSLDVNGPGMNGLSGLIKDRNALVHYKSSPLPQTRSPEEWALVSAEIAETYEQFLRSAEAAMRTIVLLSLELDRILGTPAAVLGYYGKRAKGLPVSPKQLALKEMVDNCRRIDSNAVAKSKNASVRSDAHPQGTSSTS